MSMYRAISVYQNYTGQKQCYDISASTSPDLGTDGWDVQVRRRCVQRIHRGSTGVHGNGDAHVLQWHGHVRKECMGFGCVHTEVR